MWHRWYQAPWCILDSVLCTLLFLYQSRIFLPSNNMSAVISSQTHSQPYFVLHKKQGMPWGKFTICCTRKSMWSLSKRDAADMIWNNKQMFLYLDSIYIIKQAHPLTFFACPIMFLSQKYTKKDTHGTMHSMDLCHWIHFYQKIAMINANLCYCVCKLCSETNLPLYILCYACN